MLSPYSIIVNENRCTGQSSLVKRNCPVRYSFTKTIFVALKCPRRIPTASNETSKCSARSSLIRSFAFPSSRGAETQTRSRPSRPTSTDSFFFPVVTLTRYSIRFFLSRRVKYADTQDCHLNPDSTPSFRHWRRQRCCGH